MSAVFGWRNTSDLQRSWARATSPICEDPQRNARFEACSEGEVESVETETVSQERGALYSTVDDFVSVGAPKLNREPQLARARRQLVQHQSLAAYRIQ